MKDKKQTPESSNENRIHIEGIIVDCCLVDRKTDAAEGKEEKAAALKIAVAPLRKDAVNRTNLDTQKMTTFAVAVENITANQEWDFGQVAKNIARLREEFRKSPDRNPGEILPYGIIIDAPIVPKMYFKDGEPLFMAGIPSSGAEVINLSWDKEERKFNPKRSGGEENSATLTVVAVKQSLGSAPDSLRFLVAAGGIQPSPSRQVIVTVDTARRPKVARTLADSVRDGNPVTVTGPMKTQTFQGGKQQISMIIINAIKASAVKLAKTREQGKKTDNGPKL